MWNKILEFLNKDLYVNPSHLDTRCDAKDRLKLVLMHDRTQISAPTMEKMRQEIIDVITRYVEVDTDALQLNLEKDSNTLALVANIPVIKAKAIQEEETETKNEEAEKVVKNEEAEEKIPEVKEQTVAAS